MFLWSKVYLETDKSPEEVVELLEKYTTKKDFSMLVHKDILFYGSIEKDKFNLQNFNANRMTSYIGKIERKNDKTVISFSIDLGFILAGIYLYVIFDIVNKILNSRFDAASLIFYPILLMGIALITVIFWSDKNLFRDKLKRLLAAKTIKM